MLAENRTYENLDLILETAVSTLFPNSTLYYDYSVDLSHRKFFEFYGNIALCDMFHLCEHLLTKSESRLFKHIIAEWKSEHPIYRHINYSVNDCYHFDILENVETEMWLYGYANIPEQSIERINRICNNRLIELQNSLLELCDDYINSEYS